MVRILKFLTYSVASVLASGIFLLLCYDFAVYLPAKRLVLQDILVVEPEPSPPLVRSYLEVPGALSKVSVANIIYWRTRDGRRPSRLREHAERLLFSLGTAVHVSEEEAVTLFSAFAENSYGTGLSAYAKGLFDKPLSQLSADEVAEMVSLRGIKRSHDEWVARRKEQLHAAVKGASSQGRR